MRATSSSRLLNGVLSAGFVMTYLYCRDDAATRAGASREARLCATQTEDQVAERIAGCTRIIGTGKLRGEALGVAYAMRGLAYLDRADMAHAIGDFNRAIDLAPNFAPAYQNRGNAWYARGNFGQALADYDKAIALEPEEPSPYVNRAAVKRDLGYNEGALADYQKAISLRGNNANSFSGRGQLYLRQKDYARATGDFDQAVRLDPSAEEHMLRAQAREAAGELDAALRDYQEASRRDPKSLPALNAQAALWRKKGRHRQGHRHSRPRHSARRKPVADLSPSRRSLAR